jgi:hypothetical protein
LRYGAAISLKFEEKHRTLAASKDVGLEVDAEKNISVLSPEYRTKPLYEGRYSNKYLQMWQSSNIWERQ